MGAGFRLLLVEDDLAVRQSLRLALLDEDFEVLEAATGQEGLARLEGRPDAVLLDLGLPDLDGLEVCRHARAAAGTPIVIISARAGREDVAAALAAGADDYLAKPFRVAELAGRVRALLRPPRRPPSGSRQRKGTIELHFESHEVSTRGRRLALTRTEFRLLCELAAELGEVVTEEELLSHVWGRDSRGLGVLDARIGSLRWKLDAAGGLPSITRTVGGYRLEA